MQFGCARDRDRQQRTRLLDADVVPDRTLAARTFGDQHEAGHVGGHRQGGHAVAIGRTTREHQHVGAGAVGEIVPPHGQVDPIRRAIDRGVVAERQHARQQDLDPADAAAVGLIDRLYAARDRPAQRDLQFLHAGGDLQRAFGELRVRRRREHRHEGCARQQAIERADAAGVLGPWHRLQPRPTARSCNPRIEPAGGAELGDGHPGLGIDAAHAQRAGGPLLHDQAQVVSAPGDVGVLSEQLQFRLRAPQRDRDPRRRQQGANEHEAAFAVGRARGAAAEAGACRHRQLDLRERTAVGSHGDAGDRSGALGFAEFDRDLERARLQRHHGMRDATGQRQLDMMLVAAGRDRAEVHLTCVVGAMQAEAAQDLAIAAKTTHIDTGQRSAAAAKLQDHWCAGLERDRAKIARHPLTQGFVGARLGDATRRQELDADIAIAWRDEAAIEPTVLFGAHRCRQLRLCRRSATSLRLPQQANFNTGQRQPGLGSHHDATQRGLPRVARGDAIGGESLRLGDVARRLRIPGHTLLGGHHGRRRCHRRHQRVRAMARQAPRADRDHQQHRDADQPQAAERRRGSTTGGRQHLRAHSLQAIPGAQRLGAEPRQQRRRHQPARQRPPQQLESARRPHAHGRRRQPERMRDVDGG